MKVWSSCCEFDVMRTVGSCSTGEIVWRPFDNHFSFSQTARYVKHRKAAETNEVNLEKLR